MISEGYTVEAVVPPNTRASVTLPGGEGNTIEVGSGAHQWSYFYQPPQPSRRSLTMESSLSEVIADPAAWAAVLRVIRNYMPEYNAGEIGQNGALAMPLSRVFQFGEYPNRDELLAAIQDALQAGAPAEGVEVG